MEWVFLEETDSTNRVAKELARQGAPHGTAVLAKVTDLQQELLDTRTALEQVEREHAALLFESLTGEVLA